MKLLRNITAAFIFTGIVGFALFGSGCAYARKVLAKDKLNQGVIAFNEGHREEAKVFFQDAIGYDPDNPVAQLYYGAALVKDYREQENKSEAKKKEIANQALDVFQKALALSGSNCTNKDNATSNIAVIYDDLNDEDSWRTWMLKRVEDSCSTKEAKVEGYYAIGIRYYNCSHEQTQRYSDKAKLALNDLNHYRDMDYPAALPDKRKAEECVSKGLEYIEKSLQQDPENGNSMIYKGLFYRERLMMTKDPAKRKELDQMAMQFYDQAVVMMKKREAERKQKKGSGTKQRQETTSSSVDTR
jgi:tetratricopeptide (TPR) repeat protein